MSVADLDALEGNLATVTDDEWLAAHESWLADGVTSMADVRWDPGLDAAELYGQVDVDLNPILQPAPTEEARPGLRSADAGDVARMARIMARLRAAGVLVNEMPGWEARGRTWERVPIGIVDHHDASSLKSGEAGALGVITNGREGIPGPLSQFQVGRCLDGRCRLWIVAAGRANHAGRGGGIRFGPDVCPVDAGNSYVYGAEKAHDGLGEPITAAAHLTADILFEAVLSELTGRAFDPTRVRGHREYTPRKIDPVYSMDWRRARVAALHSAPTTPPPPPAPEAPPMFLIIKDGIHQHTWDGYNDPMWIRTTMVLSKLAPALARLPRADFTGAEFDAWLVQLDASRNEWPKVRNATAEKAAERTTAYLANPAFNPGTVIDAAARGLLTSVLAGLGKLQEADSADTQVIVEALTVQLRAALADRVVSVDVTLDGGTGPRPAGEAGPVGAAAPADVVEPTPTYPDRALEDGDIVDGVVVPDDDDEDRFDAPKGSTAL